MWAWFPRILWLSGQRCVRQCACMSMTTPCCHVLEWFVDVYDPSLAPCKYEGSLILAHLFRRWCCVLGLWSRRCIPGGPRRHAWSFGADDRVVLQYAPKSCSVVCDGAEAVYAPFSIVDWLLNAQDHDGCGCSETETESRSHSCAHVRFCF